ncbi:MAG: ABC transporter ATP-binding protein [Planctomycetota bacterium]|nr:ABC transporter ATP-binding protein [Planctomycetota bacterium]
MNALEVLNITKTFGRTTALDHISFEVAEGDAVALIGPNGAGKTTLLRILATLMKPDSGYAKVLGQDGRFQASRVRRMIGYMPDIFGMYEDLNVTEYLEFFAGIHRIHGEVAAKTVQFLIDLLELDEIKDRPTSALSRGMQQRVGLARTLMHDPKILILDEPAANLDPRSRIEMREVLKELRRMGKTILISSHILMELDILCNKLLCLDRGKVLYYGGIEEVAERLTSQKEIIVRIQEDGQNFGKSISAENTVESVTERDGEIHVILKEGVQDYSFIARLSVERGVTLLGLREEEPRLEDVFLRLTGEEAGEA